MATPRPRPRPAARPDRPGAPGAAGESPAARLARLRARVAELEAAAARREEAEAALRARTHALAERVKELRCLFSVSRVLNADEASLGEILQQVVDVLPAALQYPENACARLVLDGHRHRTANWARTPWRLRVDVYVDERRAGLLEVGYLRRCAPPGVDPFLDEERAVVQAVVERLADTVELKAAEERLRRYQRELRSLASRLVLVEERERREMALALHDRLGQTLALARLRLEALARSEAGAAAREPLREVEAMLRECIGETRSLTWELSPPVLYELGLAPALRSLAERFQARAGLRVEVDAAGRVPALPEGALVMLFRSVHELLSNVVRHARASCARVVLRANAKGVRVTVEDDGAGFDAAAAQRRRAADGAFGLFSIRERLEHLGGRLELESAPGHGTRVGLRVPGASRAEQP